MPTPNLPPGQARVYRAMVDHRNAHGVWPTLRDIGDQLGISLATVLATVRAMIREGVAERIGRGAHCYSVHPDHMPEPENIIIPIMGRIRAENMR